MKINFQKTLLGMITISAFYLSGCQSDERNQNDDETLVYINANIIDVESQTIRPSHISVKNGKILSINSTKPELLGKRVVDLNDKYVMPGLIDMHVHSWGNGSVQSSYQWIGTRGSLRAALYSGVFGVLDLFSEEDKILGYRDAQDKEAVEASLFAAGPCITAPNGHCSQFGRPTRLIETPEQAHAEVADLALKKPNVIKVVFDSADHGSTPPPTINKATLSALVKEAKKHNIPTVVHVGSWEDVRGAAEVGASMVTHTPMEKMPEDIPELMKVSGTAIIPTITVQTEWESALSEELYFDNELLKSVTTPELLADYDFDIEQEQFKGLKAYVERHQRNYSSTHMDNAILSLYEAGVPILAGTDAGNPFVFQGYSIHRELYQIVEAGVPTWGALHGATIGAAKELGMEWGIKQGAQANFIVLDRSPVENILNTQSIHLLVKNGYQIDRIALKNEINPNFWQKMWMYATNW